MECPKCHRIIDDNAESCPHCHKVFTLVCPNCHNKSLNPVCENCGYIILEKCSKCGKTVDTSREKCKCGFSVKTSVAYQECETDEFASLIIKFSALKSIRRVLGSQELFKKFKYRLNNLLTAQLKNIEGKIITYGDTTVVNFNKELSFPTSTNKAIRLALKIVNAFSELNLNVQENLGTSLKLNITVIKKNAEQLLENIQTENNVKLLTVKKDEKKYLKEMQIILDQDVQDCVAKDYQTDSLYSVDIDGKSLMFYEIILSKYVLPPNQNNTDEEETSVLPQKIAKKQEKEPNKDIYGFKVFDINAKCKFEKDSANNLLKYLDSSSILTIRAEKELLPDSSEILDYYKKQGIKVIRAVCTEASEYRPWGIFEQLFRDYYNLSAYNGLINPNIDFKRFNVIKNLLYGNPQKASTPEDARFAYMEDFGAFLSSLSNCVVLIENFEKIDDTTLQTLELYFDKFKNIKPKFIFITNKDICVHRKIKGLLRTPVYTELTIEKSSTDTYLSNIKEEASDFIQSFYYEKIKENCRGSKLYFDNAIRYLKEKDILVSFDGKLIIKNNDSVLLPIDIYALLKARLKTLGKNMDASMILAYSVFLGPRLDFSMLELLGIKDVQKNAELLAKARFLYINNGFLYITNFEILEPVLEGAMKKEVEQLLAKNILAKLKGLDSSLIFRLMGILGLYKEEYLVLWKNSQFAMLTGDYDAYLKNCLGSLSLIENIEGISDEEIEENKKEVFQNILMSLYGYSPEKIYSIENILLMDAIKENDNEKIVKLSNLMLQGALISSNYTDAFALLHNILTRLPNPTLIVDGKVNTKFLLLSLVNIEILFNIGKFKECIETAEDILTVIKPEMLENIKPASFSLNFFVSHLMDTFRLVGFAKLITNSNDTDEFFQKVSFAFNAELPEKNCIYAIKDFLNGEDYVPSNIDEESPFAKTIYLILQEFSEHSNDFKAFAQNIYQAKQLAIDIHQLHLELLCDLLIAYSYANMGITEKANAIYEDILKTSEKSAIYNINILAKYFIAKLKIKQDESEEALIIINDALAILQDDDNQAVLLYVLFEKLFIDLAESMELADIDIESEKQKLEIVSENLSRLVSI